MRHLGLCPIIANPRNLIQFHQPVGSLAPRLLSSSCALGSYHASQIPAGPGRTPVSSLATGWRVPRALFVLFCIFTFCDKREYEEYVETTTGYKSLRQHCKALKRLLNARPNTSYLDSFTVPNWTRRNLINSRRVLLYRESSKKTTF